MKRFCNGVQVFIAGSLSAYLLLALSLLVFVHPVVSYYCKVSFARPNGQLLLLGVAVLVCVMVVSRKSHKEDVLKTERAPSKCIAFLSVVLFLLQAFIFWHMYFRTGWDVDRVLMIAQEKFVTGQITGDMSWYLSRYQNNLMITGILIRVFEWCGMEMPLENVLYAAILVASALASIAGALLFSVVKQIAEKRYAYGAWVVYAVHIGLSPWITIPYSDSFGLLVPMLILWIYFRPETDSKLIWIMKWTAIGLVGYIGLRLKPQIFIVVIAIGGMEVLRLMQNFTKEYIQPFCKRVLFMALGVCVSILFYAQIVVPTVGFQEFPDVAFGPSHFLMMGLNAETLGGYSQEDADFSASFPDVPSRNRGNWEIIKCRIQDYGPAGLAKHLRDKTMLNFGDGTYAWGAEGNFYLELYDDKDLCFSPFFKNLYYNDGKYYPWFAAFEQAIWLTLLLCSSGCVFYVWNRRQDIPEEISALLLALIGLILFELLFESRARYLFTYGPFFIIAASIGLQGYLDLGRSMRNTLTAKQ